MFVVLKLSISSACINQVLILQAAAVPGATLHMIDTRNILMFLGTKEYHPPKYYGLQLTDRAT
jgi:hypothetical protein